MTVFISKNALTWASRVLPFFAMLLSLIGFGGPAAALTTTSLSVSSLAPGGTVLFPNDSNDSCNSGPRAATVAYRFQNSTSAPIKNLTATAAVTNAVIPTNSVGTFALGGGQAAKLNIGTLAAGESKTLFWFMTYPCWGGSSGSYTISSAKLSITVEDQATTPLTQAFDIATQKATSAQAGGTIGAPPVLGPGAIVGQVITYTVTYNFGNVGANEYINVQPAGNTSFNAGCFQMVGSRVTNSGIGGVLANHSSTSNTLDFLSSGQSGSNNPLTVEYSYIYKCAGTSTTAIAYAIQRSGQVLKYAASNYGAYPITFVQATNAFVINKSATPTQFASGGGPVTYTVTVQNTSQQYDAYLDRITDVLPTMPATAPYQGLAPGSLVTVTNSTVLPAAGATATVDFVSNIDYSKDQTKAYYIPRNSTLTLKYTVQIPTTLGRYTNSATGLVGNATVFSSTPNTPARATVQNGVTALTLSKNHGQFTVGNYVANMSGGTYTFTLTNTGNLASSGSITLTDNLPSGLTYASASGTGWTCTGTTQVTCNFTGTLAANNGSTTLTLHVNVPAGITTNIVNSAGVSGGGIDSAGNPLTATSNIDTVPTSNLALTKTADAVLVQPNGNVTYTLTLRNTGPSAATGVTIEDVLPAGTQYVSAGAGVSCNTGSSPIVCTWTVANIGANATTSASITVTMTAAGSITNTAQVKATPDTFDPNSTPGNGTSNSEDDTGSVTVQVGSADLTVTKAANAHVLPGSTIQYTIAVTNQGASEATNVVITDALASSVTLQSWSASPSAQAGTFTNMNGTLRWTHVTMPAGTTVTYTLAVTAPDVTAVRNGTNSVVNTASVTTDTYDPNAGNNTSTTATKVAYVELTKVMRNITQNFPSAGAYSRSDGTPSNPQVPNVPGDVIEYCVDFRNFGSLNASNFTINDPAPANTSVRLDSGSYSLGGGGTQALPAGALTASGLMFTVPGTLNSGQYGRVCFRVTTNS